MKTLVVGLADPPGHSCCCCCRGGWGRRTHPVELLLLLSSWRVGPARPTRSNCCCCRRRGRWAHTKFQSGEKKKCIKFRSLAGVSCSTEYSVGCGFSIPPLPMAGIPNNCIMCRCYRFCFEIKTVGCQSKWKNHIHAPVYIRVTIAVDHWRPTIHDESAWARSWVTTGPRNDIIRSIDTTAARLNAASAFEEVRSRAF